MGGGTTRTSEYVEHIRGLSRCFWNREISNKIIQSSGMVKRSVLQPTVIVWRKWRVSWEDHGPLPSLSVTLWEDKLSWKILVRNANHPRFIMSDVSSRWDCVDTMAKHVTDGSWNIFRFQRKYHRCERLECKKEHNESGVVPFHVALGEVWVGSRC
jgi:hypothetical protein